MRTNVLELLGKPWAIVPEKLLEMQQIYAAHLRGEAIDLAAVEARIGKPLQNEQQGYSVEANGVAVLPIDGVLSKRMNLLSAISGGTSTQIAQRDFQAALNDPSVSSIVLLVDSPGGAVDGIEEFANAILSARGTKPVTALISGMGASAAYWLASAASKIYITSSTALVGSIGVVASHTDYSARDAQAGVKITEITAGKYKRIASEHAPLSEEGRASIQEQVDAIHRVLVDAVSKNRGMAAQSVAGTEGKLFVGRDAIQAGLVDGVATLDQLIADQSKRQGSSPSVTAKVATPATPPPAPKPQIQVQQPKPEAPTYDGGLTREAQGLQLECAAYGIPLSTTDAIDHVFAERGAKQGKAMTGQQIARAAQIKQARLRKQGILVSTTEALQRVMQEVSR